MSKKVLNKSSIGPSGFIARQTFSFYGRVAENSFETCLFLMRSTSNEGKFMNPLLCMTMKLCGVYYFIFLPQRRRGAEE
jgi:hypothetical protein